MMHNEIPPIMLLPVMLSKNAFLKLVLAENIPRRIHSLMTWNWLEWIIQVITFYSVEPRRSKFICLCMTKQAERKSFFLNYPIRKTLSNAFIRPDQEPCRVKAVRPFPFRVPPWSSDAPLFVSVLHGCRLTTVQTRVGSKFSLFLRQIIWIVIYKNGLERP